MMPRVAHGAVLLVICLTAVGAVASAGGTGSGADTAAASTLSADLPSIVRHTTAADGVATGPVIEVPIRSGRLADEIIPETAQPIAIRVAGIALEAPVIPVGVDDNNQFAVPAADTVGWYRYSSSPGEPGASVLAAHVDYGGQAGAFFNLDEVLAGDVLEVEMEDGRVFLYEVTGNTEYDKTELPFEELFRKDGAPVLQLITCGGTFNPDERSYEANVVVTAVPISA